MIYIRLPTGDHGWGVVGDNLANALAVLTPIERVANDRSQQTISGPLLESSTLEFRRPHNLKATRHVAYAVFEEDLTIRRNASINPTEYDAVVTACHWCEDVLRDAGLKTVSTIYHGVDGVRFRPELALRQRLHDRFVIFSGGKFELRKGQDIVVRAFKIFGERHADAFLIAAWHNPWKYAAYTMVGSPYYPLNPSDETSCHEVIMRWLVDTGVDLDRIQVVPRIPNTEMAAIYGNSDVGLFPNRCEGATNLVMMEYMACGRPVVATDFSGHKDILSNANSVRLCAWEHAPFVCEGKALGCWCEPDVEEIVEALEHVYRDRDGLVALGRQAANDLAEWTWDRAARRFLSLLNADPRSGVAS